MVKTLHFHCREHGFDPGIELRSHKPDRQKKKKNEREELRIAVKYNHSIINNSGIIVLMDSFPSKINGTYCQVVLLCLWTVFLLKSMALIAKSEEVDIQSLSTNPKN